MFRNLALLQNIAERLHRIAPVLLLAVGHQKFGNLFYHMAGAVDNRLTAVVAAAAV